MKILFLGINAKQTHSNIALFYLKNYVNTNLHTYQIRETTINDDIHGIITDIVNIYPDVLCLSCYVWNQDYIKKILNDIKKILENIIIVCGGPDISYNAKKWINNHPSINYIICGHGEKAFYELQENNFSSSFYKRLEKYKTGIIIKTKNYPFKDIEFPCKQTDIHYFKHKYIYYESSRGCPFSCSYCISSISDQKIEYKSINQVIKDLDILLITEPKIIKFVDRSFNFNNDLCISIWKYILNLHTKTIFHFEIHPQYLNVEQIEVLRKIPKNRIQFEIGIQTTNSRTLKLIDRTGEWKNIKHNLEKLTEITNIHKHYDILAGLPNESLKHIKKSFNDILSLKPDLLQLGFLKILPGTKIEDEKEKYDYKYQENAPYRVFASNSLSFKQMYKIEQVELATKLICNNKKLKTFTNEYIFKVKDSFAYLYRISKLYLTNDNNKRYGNSNTYIFKTIIEDLKRLYKENDKSFLLDCIMFDWFLYTENIFYEDFFDADKCNKFRASFYDIFKDKWQKLKIKEAAISKDKINEIIRPPKLKNAMFFVPITKKFNIEKLNNYDGAVLVNKIELYYVKILEKDIQLHPINDY